MWPWIASLYCEVGYTRLREKLEVGYTRLREKLAMTAENGVLMTQATMRIDLLPSPDADICPNGFESVPDILETIMAEVVPFVAGRAISGPPMVGSWPHQNGPVVVDRIRERE